MPNESASPYSRKNPYPGRLLINRRLNSPDSEKDTRHFELALDGSGISYEVGDSMAVYPTNDPDLVEEILTALCAKGDEPIELRIVHVDLYFFFDIDIVILALEVAADNLPLGVAQEALFRFGRAYPAYWEEDKRGGHCPWLVEWLCPKGEVLARSDYEKREKYLAFVC